MDGVGGGTKIGKSEVPINLYLASAGAAMECRGQNERGRAELRPSLLLTIWKRHNFYLDYLTVQGLFFSRKFTQICDYTEQKFRLHQY